MPKTLDVVIGKGLNKGDTIDPELLAEPEKYGNICPKCHTAIVQGGTERNPGGPVCECSRAAEDAERIAALRAQFVVPPQAAPMAAEAPRAAQPPPVAPRYQNAPVAAPEASPPADLKSMLFALKNAPSQAQIDAWKREWGNVYMFAFDVKDIVVWRPLRNAEWKQFQSQEVLMQDQNKLQEHVVLRCVLWPQLGPIEINLCRAGFVPTLANVIMQGSYFLPPELAINLTVEL